MKEEQNNGALAPTQECKGNIVYIANGEQITLSRTIVRNYLIKGDGDKSKVLDTDIVQFMNICQFNQLNPFLNEAYLVKFGNSPAQMIVSKEALFKRAEAHPNYDGFQSGVIVSKDDEVKELEGCFVPNGWTLVGGWANVYRSDRKFPAVSKVNLEEYDKDQSIWKDKKPTMISKVAKVQAMREAFPSTLGAMYISEEQPRDTTFEEVDSKLNNEKAEFANKNEMEIDFEEIEDSQQKVEKPKKASKQVDDMPKAPLF